MHLLLKNPLAILAEGALGGLVVENGKIGELLLAGQTPQHDQVFNASQHVVVPGLINSHHHFYQAMTRAHPTAINRGLFDWLKALYPIWARLNPQAHRIATRFALTELLMSGITTTSDHHNVFPAGLDDAGCGWLSNRTWLAHGIHFNKKTFYVWGGTRLAFAIAQLRIWFWLPVSVVRVNLKRQGYHLDLV